MTLMGSGMTLETVVISAYSDVNYLNNWHNNIF